VGTRTGLDILEKKQISCLSPYNEKRSYTPLQNKMKLQSSVIRSHSFYIEGENINFSGICASKSTESSNFGSYFVL
jgi:hypothetical protein